MRTLLVTGKPLSSAWASKFENLGFSVVNGSADALARLGANFEEADRELTESELARCLAGVEVYVYGGLEPASRDALKSAHDLKFISFLGTGWADPGCVDAATAADQGIRVSNTPHANALSVAEFALGAIIGSSRHVYSMSQETAAGHWNPVRGSDVSGKTLGVVGLGAIGSRLAQFARLGMGMEVLYFGPNRKADLEELLRVKRCESLESLFSQCDIVSIHAPASSSTEGMIGAREFTASKNAPILINCASPEIVDGRALHDALLNGALQCAVFDGKYASADLDRELRSMGPERYVQFPRSAWLTVQSYDRMAAMSHASVSAYSTDEKPIPFLVLDAGQ